jgi:hypothetical protein
MARRSWSNGCSAKGSRSVGPRFGGAIVKQAPTKRRMCPRACLPCVPLDAGDDVADGPTPDKCCGVRDEATMACRSARYESATVEARDEVGAAKGTS